MKLNYKLCFILTNFIISIMLNISPLQALSETEWISDNKSHFIRLISSYNNTNEEIKQFYIAVEMELDEDWRTYWRSPGDSGIAPTFDFSQSDNIKDYKVLYPYPKRFFYDGGHYNGYHDKVVYIIEIIRDKLDNDNLIKLKLDYGICKDICIPASQNFELLIENEENVTKAHNFEKFEEFLSLIPKSNQQKEDEKFQILAFNINHDEGKKPYAEFSIKKTNYLTDNQINIFFEGPEKYYYSIPKFIKSDNGKYSYKLEIHYLKKLEEIEGQEFYITVGVNKHYEEKTVIYTSK